MEIVIALAVGGVIGWLASMVMGTNVQMGIVANILVGIIGSWLGFWLAPKVGIISGEGWVKWLVAIGGAVILIFLLKILGIFK